MSFIKYLRTKFTDSIKKSVRLRRETDSQPFRANGLGPGGIIFLDIFLLCAFGLFFLWDFSIFYLLSSVVESYLAYLQWKSDFFFSLDKKMEYQKLRFYYADKYLYILQNWAFNCNSYLNELNFFFFIIRALPFLGALLLYGCGESFIFIHYYGVNEMEQVQPKMAIIQFLDVMCFSYKADRLSKFSDIREMTDYGDAQLLNHFVREIEAMATVDHLFIDYRRAQDSNALDNIRWHNFPGDLLSVSFRFFGGFFGRIGLYLNFDFGFFMLTIVGSCFAFEFFDEFDESYRYLSTITDYRKLFYRQIVFLPQAIAEVYGYTGLGPEFFLNSVRKEINSSRRYYDKKVKSSEGGADTAFERIGKDVTSINVDFACVLYEKFFSLELSQIMRGFKEELKTLSLPDSEFIQFLFYLKTKQWPPEMQQRIEDELTVYYAYLQEFSRTNDPATVNREFRDREYRSALLKRTKNITKEQDAAMKRLFSLEGLAMPAKLSDFAGVLGQEYVARFVDSMQSEADKEYAEMIAKKKEEKLKKKLARRKNVFKSLRISFNADRQQFLVDYFIERWPFFRDWFFINLSALKIKIINSFFLCFGFILRKLWFFLKKFWCFLFQNFWRNLYTGFFIGIQWFFNLPFLIFFFFFWRRVSEKTLLNLKLFVINFNKNLTAIYLRGIFNYKKETIDYQQQFFTTFFPRIKWHAAMTPYEICRQIYFLLKIYFLQWWHEENYIDIFDIMENDEIRHEVIARVMNSPLDAGAAAVSDENRAWDDPRIVSIYSNRKVIDASAGITFGSVGLGLLGACSQYATYSAVAAIPFDIFFIENLWSVGEGLVIFSTHSADWDLFDTWFDSVSYIHIHADRYKIEEYCTHNLQEILVALEDENDVVYIDDYIFDEDALPFGRRCEVAFKDVDMLQIESFALKTESKRIVQRVGRLPQFYHLKYPYFLYDLIKKHNLNEYTEYVTGSDRGINWDYKDRVKRYAIHTSRERTITKYYSRPLDAVDRSWQLHKRLYRFWLDYKTFGFHTVMRNYYSWNWRWFRRNRHFWGDNLEVFSELRPFSILEYEERSSYYDFHVLNYPIFARFYLDDGGDEPMFEDGNEDSQDETANGQYVHKNTQRIFWESFYTIFKLDFFLFCERWYAKFCMERIAVEYYLDKLAVIFIKLSAPIFSLIQKFKDYFINL